MILETNQSGCGKVRDMIAQVIDIIAGRLREVTAGSAGRDLVSPSNHCGKGQRFCGKVRVTHPLVPTVHNQRAIPWGRGPLDQFKSCSEIGQFRTAVPTLALITIGLLGAGRV